MSSAFSAAPTSGRASLADVALVAVGGAAGAGLRHLVGLTLPDEPFSVGVIVANLLGAMLLGVLAGALPGRRTGLFWGTGVLGAFTTFSAITVQAAQLSAAVAVLYLLGQIGVGVGLARLGLGWGRQVADRRGRRVPG